MTTSLATLERRAVAQAMALDVPRRAARSLIAAKLADARAHALNALTERARSTPDGRQTIAHVRRSRSYSAATSRIAELASALVVDVADWREASYRDAFAWWADHVPEGCRRAGDLAPTAANVSWIRGMALHGMPLVTEVTAATTDAGRRLLATLAQACSRALDPKAATDLLTAWETRTVNALNAVADRLLSDSQGMADRKAGRDVCRPDVLHPDPTLPK